jgi:hypothetical protein
MGIIGAIADCLECIVASECRDCRLAVRKTVKLFCDAFSVITGCLTAITDCICDCLCCGYVVYAPLAVSGNSEARDE